MNHIRTTNWFHRMAMAILAVTTLCLTVSFAGDAHASDDSVTIDVEIILASDGGSGVASELRSFAGRLQNQFGQFDSFRSLTSTSFRLNIGEEHSIGIPGVGSAAFGFSGMNGNRFKLDVGVPGGDTTVESPRGGVFFVAGPRAPGGGTIILMIRTQ